MDVTRRLLQQRIDSGEITHADVDLFRRGYRWIMLSTGLGALAGLPVWWAMSRRRPPPSLASKLATSFLLSSTGSFLGFTVGGAAAALEVNNNMQDSKRKVKVFEEVMMQSKRIAEDRRAGRPITLPESVGNSSGMGGATGQDGMEGGASWGANADGAGQQQQPRSLGIREGESFFIHAVGKNVLEGNTLLVSAFVLERKLADEVLAPSLSASLRLSVLNRRSCTVAEARNVAGGSAGAEGSAWDRLRKGEHLPPTSSSQSNSSTSFPSSSSTTAASRNPNQQQQQDAFFAQGGAAGTGAGAGGNRGGKSSLADLERAAFGQRTTSSTSSVSDLGNELDRFGMSGGSSSLDEQLEGSFSSSGGAGGRTGASSSSTTGQRRGGLGGRSSGAGAMGATGSQEIVDGGLDMGRWK